MNEKQMQRFITIEGIDGAGKSTYIPYIQDFLESKGEKVVLTREPGGTELGEKLRGLLLSHPMDTLTETMLMFAARAEHLEKIIKPALARGEYVICDRFTDSTIAYQSSAKGLPIAKIHALETLVQDDLRPSMTLVFDVPLDVSRSRLNKTSKIPDRFEREPEEFHSLVSQGYKDIVKKDPSRCRIIDSSRTIEETSEQVLLHLEEFYAKLKDQPIKKNKP